MTSNSRSSSKCKDDGSNGLKKKVVNGTGSAATGSGAGDSYSLRKSVRDSSSNKEVPATSQSTRRSERFVKSASVSPVSNRKSGRISKELTPSPLRRSDRGKKQISSGSLGQKKSEEKVSVAVDLDQMKTKREKSLSELTGENKCEGKKSGRGKKQGYDGRAFRALFKRQSNVKAAAGMLNFLIISDKNGISSSERDSVVEETSAIAEKLVVDLSTEEQGQTPEVAGSSLTRKSQNDGIDVERGDDTTLSKRKIDLVVDLDASATDGRREDCTSSSDNLHSSSGCKTHSVFRRCATCSKRQRYIKCSTQNNIAAFETFLLDNHGYVVELQKLPAGSPPGLGPSHLDTLNKLREFRHKGQNAVVFDDQDRIMKTILYIVSLSNVCQPFLIVTTSFWLPVWESEFLRVAPSIDVVVYDGSSDNRKSIRTLEFYDDGGGIMLQVLLSSVEIIVEDLHFLESMKWKVVIVDECQQSLISSQFEQIKMLVADVKLLLYGGPLKDDVTEYVNLLSLLDSCGIDVSNAESSDTSKFKERLSQYIASECKSNSPRFVEFWVPSIISNVQLEQYCDTLLSKSMCLCLNSKTDPVGALRQTVFLTRKSCDHPYIVDPSLKVLITKDLPPINFLDVEIRASGKLQLLEMILSQIRRQQLRVLLLFQSVAGSGRDTLGLGDILDDFLRERFGENTYERLDGGAVSSKLRQKALNSFNKGSGRFVFLLENRACLPSIRLVSVDTIIIFDSDWNPANDIKALNRISIDSQSKQMKIFRLYSAFTVEEKVLILAKQGLSLESNLENISRATSNTLLMWGVSSLFNRLDEFHSTPDANVSSEQTLARKVVDEILALLSQHGECDGIDNYSISKIQQRGGVYSSNLRLLGEQQVISSDCEHPHIFWENLLKGRNPKWKFLTGQTHRHRKKVQYFDDSPKQAECEAVEVGKKRKKGGANFSPGLEQNKAIGGTYKIAGASGIPEDHGLCCMERQDASVTDLLNSSNATTIASEKSRVPDAQNNFNLSVKTSMLKLCEILKLSDDIKNLAERFLEYVVSNHQVSRDENILQAFLISLCWCSASLLNQKVDRVGSLLLAQKHLKFICNEKEADSVYSAVRKLKKAFKENVISDISKGNILGVGKSCKGTLNEKILQLQNVKLEHEGTRDQVCTGEKVQEDKTHNVDKEIKLKLIQKKFRKQIAKLKQKQDEEIKEFNRSWQAQREDIEKKQKVESAIIGAMYTHEALRMDKLKASDNECAKKLEELERQKEISFKQLKARHLDALSDENRKLSQGAKSATPFVTEVAGQKELPLPQSGVQNEGEYSRVGEYGSPTVSENVPTLSRLPNLIACEKNIVEKVPGNTCGMISNQASKDDEVENMALVNVPVATSKQPIIIDGSVNIHENTGSFCRNQSKNKNPEQNVLNDPGRIILSEPLKRIPEKVIGDANSLELKTPAVEYHAENDTVDGTSSETPNVLENHTHGGEANSSADVKSSSTEILKLPEKQPALSTACNQVEVSALQQLQSEISTVPVLGHTSSDLPPASGSAPRLTNERDTFPQNRSENTMELSGQDFSLDGQIAEENDQARHLANEHHEIPPRLVEHPTELPDQVLPLLGANVDLHTTTDVIETPLPQNQPDLPSSTLDHQPVHLSTYLLNSEAVPQVNESTTELPRQAVVSTRVNMSVQGQRAEHQVPSRIPKVTSYSDPLQNQLEGIRKETEQAIKLHEEGKMRLKFEFEESVAQLRRNYEAKCKEAEDAFLWKKKELDTNHNKVLVNKILADAFRSKCVEPSRYTGSQHAVHPGRGQHLNQLPQHTAPRPSPITVASSAGQPASSQQNTALRSQPASRLHLNTVSSMARQPSANQQNTTLSSQYGTRILPVTASSDSQPAATQLHTTLLTQPEPGNNFVPVSSSAGQPATYQQNNEPLSQPSARISPISLASSGAHSASGQQSTQPPLQIVHQSAALFSSISTRPPQINPITLSMGNVRVGNENRARAPAPHLQAFRSASSVNTSAQRMAPGHLTPTSLPASSSYPLPCSVAPNMAPNYSSAIYSKSSTQSNAAKDMLPPGVSAPPSASMSNQELLKTHGAQRPDEPLPDLGSTLDSIDFSVFETGPSLPPSSEVPDVSTNLVCLSDED
ncbi:hypothetical protein DCAR_0623285 [Daucus carota subsp. sativus]|uniref:Helicase C-terminal domain-containing protein n=1 Tax=Daucus carota subsp. sativus TaxID=79200 RepID=A0AAF0XBD3_DAUCS|nr:hypothetical protein DCAR_0623285 [Daucus carota subsp. sativus]